MNCHTCNNTMSNVGGAYWCPRCGSISWGDADYTRDTPRLVGRAKLLVQEFKRETGYQDMWYAIEVEECLKQEG